jgi:hypothetical protein
LVWPWLTVRRPIEVVFHRRSRAAGRTCLTWLNDDYEGGETEFPRIGFRHRGRTGGAMLFLNVTPDRGPDPLTLHAGLPPTRGHKWLLSQWVRDRAQPVQ